MVTQNIIIQYGSYVIDGKVEKFRETSSYRTYSIDVDFIITGANDAAFEAALDAAEAQLLLDSQALTVKFGSTTHRTFNPATPTGMMIRTSLNKTGSRFDTDRSRMVSWRCDVQLPASSASDNYRESGSYTIEYTESRRVSLSFTGRYTAGNSTTAYANYNANVATWITSVFTALSLTQADYELIRENIDNEDDENAFLRFTRVYQEVNFPETSAGGSPNNSAVINNARVNFSRRTENRHGNKQKGAFRIDISYSCSVDVTASNYQTLDALWTGTIKPHLITQARAEWSGINSKQAVENENVSIDVSSNTISASFTLLGSGGQGGLISIDEVVEVSLDLQITARKIWDEVPYTYNIFSPGDKITATQTVSKRQISSTVPKATADLSPNTGALLALTNPGSGNWQILSSRISDGSEFVGVDLDNKGASVQIHQTTYTKEYLWMKGGKFIQVTPGRGGAIITGSGLNRSGRLRGPRG